MHFVDRGQLNLREVVQEDQIWGYWDKGACNHLYWCATSTAAGFGELIGAKWNSFMQHVANKHDNHSSPLYKKCAHGDQIENRRWIKIGIDVIV